MSKESLLLNTFTKELREQLPHVSIDGDIVTNSDMTLQEARISGINCSINDLYHKQTNKICFRVDNGQLIAQYALVTKTSQKTTNHNLIFLLILWIVFLFLTVAHIYSMSDDYTLLFLQSRSDQTNDKPDHFFILSSLISGS